MVLDFTLGPISLSTDFAVPKLQAVKFFIGPGPMPLHEMVMVLFPAETRCSYICVLNLESKRLWENIFHIYPISFTEISPHY